jgi:hypothetical protein
MRFRRNILGQTLASRYLEQHASACGDHIAGLGRRLGVRSCTQTLVGQERLGYALPPRTAFVRSLGLQRRALGVVSGLKFGFFAAARYSSSTVGGASYIGAVSIRTMPTASISN